MRDNWHSDFLDVYSSCGHEAAGIEARRMEVRWYKVKEVVMGRDIVVPKVYDLLYTDIA